MIVKTLRTINENIPKSNNESYKQIEQLMIKYKEELNKTNNSLSLESMISIIDNKYSQLIDNIKTPMENYINERGKKSKIFFPLLFKFFLKNLNWTCN